MQFDGLPCRAARLDKASQTHPSRLNPLAPRRNKATPSSRALHVWLTATRRKVAQGNVEVIAGYRCNHGAALKLKALRRLS